jgi:WD40 repeat protein
VARLYNKIREKLLLEVRLSQKPKCLCVKDSKNIIVGSSDQISIWSIDNEWRSIPAQGVTSMSLNDDLIIACNKGEIYKLTPNEELENIISAGAHIEKIVHNNEIIVCLFKNLSMKIYDSSTYHQKGDIDCPEGYIGSIIIINSFIATGGFDSIVRLWDSHDFINSKNSSNPNEFNCDSNITCLDKKINSLIAGTTGGTVYIWNVESKELLHMLCGQRIILTLCVDNKLKNLIIGDLNGIITVWDIGRNREVNIFIANDERIIEVKFYEPDRVCSISDDCYLKVWKLKDEV